MRIAKYLLGALCALSCLSASAQTPSTTDVTNATSLGTTLANQSRGLALQRDSSGQPILNADGTAATTQVSSQSQQGDLTAFQNMVGITGLEQVANPGNGGTGLATVSTTQSFNVACQNNPTGTVNAAGGLAFKLQSCGSLPVQSITFGVCNAPQSLSTCTDASAYSQAVAVPVGSFITVSGVQVGAGCNSSNVCQISVKGQTTVGGNDTTMKAQAPQVAAQSSVVTDIGAPIASGQFANTTKSIGSGLIDCQNKNQDSMSANGTASTCGTDATGKAGTVVAASGSTSTAVQCNGPRTCVKQGTTTQNFTRSCIRTFPLTELITQYQYQTASCNLTSTTATNGTVTQTNSCVNGSTDQRTGMSLVSATDKQCTANAADGTCTSQTWTEYYASTTPATLSTAASPSAVAGACDTGMNSVTSYTGFSGGSWFGRTLPDAACTVETVDDSTGKGTGTYIQLTNADMPGCGIYTTPSVGVLCYGQPSQQDAADTCSVMDLTGCTFSGATPTTYSSGTSGLVTEQTETYACETQQTTCLQWTTGTGDSTCLDTSNQTFGASNSPTQNNDGSAMNAAIVAAAILNSTGDGVDPTADPTVPLVFTGDDERCTRATGGIGQLFGRNCCQIDLQRPVSGQLIRGGCSMSDVQLAAARRSNYTTFIGTYCSKSMHFPHHCLEDTDTYCSFNGILPRLVQEQGRTQLAQMAASSVGASVQHAGMNYSYLDSGAGSWTPAVTVNGIELHAWKWPSYCSDPAAQTAAQLANPDAFECPGIVATFVAACDNGNCGNLPQAPEYGAGAWSLIQVNPLNNNTTAVSRYAVVSGACSTSTGMCQYDAAAWPAGQGGKAVITRDLTWPFYSDQTTTATSGGAVNQMSNVADLMFQPWSEAGASDGKTMPATIRVDFSTDGGQTWSTAQVPTDTQGGNWTVPTSGNTLISGRCDLATNLCNFRVTGTTTVTAKPWGSAQSPDCTGFTAGQLSAMDFSKMDLSEFLSSVMNTVNTSTSAATNIAQSAATQVSQYNTLFQNGSSSTVTVASPVPANFARITPSQGFGPFQTTLIVSGYWPQTTGNASLDVDHVNEVTVDWGDCTTVDTLQQLDPSIVGSGYSGTHTFAAPDQLKCGAQQANVLQTITLTAYTSHSGVQKRTVSVENAWATYPGGSGGHNDVVPVTATAPANSSNVPLPPTP